MLADQMEQEPPAGVGERQIAKFFVQDEVEAADDIAATQVNDDLGFLRPTARAIDVSKHLELGRVVGTGVTGRAGDSDKAALATAVPTVDDCRAVGCEWQPGGRNKTVNVF